MQRNLEERDLWEQRQKDMELLNAPVTNHMAVLEQKYSALIDDKSSDIK